METENKLYYKYGENTIKKLNFDLWNKIISYINIDISFKQKFYLYENKIDDIPQCECGIKVKFIDMVSGYRKFCSKKCLANSIHIKQKKSKTNLDKWGVENPSQNNQIKEKVKKTNLEKFGVEYPLKSKEILEKTKQTNLEKWGVENPSQLKNIRQKAEQTNLQKFGVKHAAQNEIIKENFKSYSLKKWGVQNPSQLRDIREKAEKTNLNKFGVKHALQNEEIKKKLKETNLEKYGFDSYTKTEKFKEKTKQTNLKKYGVTNYSKLEECKEKIVETSLKKWGVTNYSKTDESKEKSKQVNNEKYGSHFISQNELFRKEKYKIAQDNFYIKYISNGTSLFKCDCSENHEFEILIDNYIQRKSQNVSLCTICYPIGDNISIKEEELFKFIESIYSGQIIQSYRQDLEIDIYLPELKIGFEFNGLYWHSEIYKDKNYHLNKTNYFKEMGIRIIHIWEDDWSFKKEIIKSQIKNWLKLTDNKIFARNCKISEVKNNDFLNENHIQGCANSVLKLGLYYNNELVSLMTFDHFEGRKKMKENEWNLSRFCNKLNITVVGGASKLLNYFKKNYQPTRIISYSDKDWSVGNLYQNIGFKKLYETNPDYKYIMDSRRVNKSRFRKSNTGISEKYLNITKIWDCGKIKFEIILKKES